MKARKAVVRVPVSLFVVVCCLLLLFFTLNVSLEWPRRENRHVAFVVCLLLLVGCLLACALQARGPAQAVVGVFCVFFLLCAPPVSLSACMRVDFLLTVHLTGAQRCVRPAITAFHARGPKTKKKETNYRSEEGKGVVAERKRMEEKKKLIELTLKKKKKKK